MDLWSLRSLGKVSALHAAVTYAFKLRYRDGGVYTIPRGPLTGYRWLHRHSHQFWMPLGLYEKETAHWIQSALSPGATFFDIGANAGYFTLLGARCVGAEGRVVAFEPVAENVESVRGQIRLNDLENVEVVASAVSDVSGHSEFVLEARNPNSHLKDVQISHAASRPSRVDLVETITLDDYVARTGRRPTVMKIDVEGAESKVLQGAQEVLRRERPMCLISTHSDGQRAACRKLLGDLGYRLTDLPGFEHELIALPTQGG